MYCRAIPASVDPTLNILMNDRTNEAIDGRKEGRKERASELASERTCFKLYLAADGFVFTKHDIILWSHIIQKVHNL